MHRVVCRLQRHADAGGAGYIQKADAQASGKSYEDSIGKHESIFTKFFADKGFVWDKYVNTDDIADFTGYPLMYCPTKLIQERRCPIFKRRMFFHEYNSYLDYTGGSEPHEFIHYLETNKLYDTGMIYENLLRVYNMADIKNCLNLSWVIPTNYFPNRKSSAKVALVIYMYFEDLIDYCYNYYMLSMPPDCDIIITTDTKDKAEQIEKKLKCGGENLWHDIKIIIIENRGHDVSALLVGAAPYIMDYDYVCFAHDKKSSQLGEGIKGYYFSERCFQNVLGSRAYVENIIDPDYFRWRLTMPTEREIYFKHLEFYFWKKRLPKDLIKKSCGERLDIMLKLQSYQCKVTALQQDIALLKQELAASKKINDELTQLTAEKEREILAIQHLAAEREHEILAIQHLTAEREHEILAIQHSKSYYAGRAITWLPRKIRDGLNRLKI